MSRVRYWRFTCDTCGKAEDFRTLYLPVSMGWKHKKSGLDVADYCSDKCLKESI